MTQDKQKHSDAKVLTFIRCKLSFIVLRSALGGVPQEYDFLLNGKKPCC